MYAVKVTISGAPTALFPIPGIPNPKFYGELFLSVYEKNQWLKREYGIGAADIEFNTTNSGATVTRYYIFNTKEKAQSFNLDLMPDEVWLNATSKAERIQYEEANNIIITTEIVPYNL